MKVEEALNFSRRVRDPHFRQVEFVQEIDFAKRLGVPYSKVPQVHQVYGSLRDGLRSLVMWVTGAK